MLVLSRRQSGSIRLGNDIKVTILKVRKGRVSVGIDAPQSVPVARDELPDWDQLSPQEVGHGRQPPVQQGRFEILLVEDDPGHAKLTCDAISACKDAKPINVAIAPTVELALETLQLDRYADQTLSRHAVPPFDLVMLDLYLPGSSGLDLLRRIRTDPVYYLTPVVMFSCEDHDGAATNCLEAGANAFVTKSTDPKAFRESVSRIASFWAAECHIPKPHVPLPK